MLQRLPITLAQIKQVIPSENLLNEICQAIYYMHQARKKKKKNY